MEQVSPFAPDRPLAGRVAIVTGASRGIGKGVAIELGLAGATVYVTGRTTGQGQSELPGTVGETAAQINAQGGNAVAVACDHGDDAQVDALFAQVMREQGRLDILVNSASGLLDNAALKDSIGKSFWELDAGMWDLYTHVGLRSHYIASRLAAQMMVPRGAGLIVNISSQAAAIYFLSVAAGACKAGLDKITADAAHELRPHGVTVVSLWPGLVATERVAMLGASGVMDTAIMESPRLSGRAVVALATDRDAIGRSGGAHYVAQLARDYGFGDVDGSTPEIPVIRDVVIDRVAETQAG